MSSQPSADTIIWDNNNIRQFFINAITFDRHCNEHIRRWTAAKIHSSNCGMRSTRQVELECVTTGICNITQTSYAEEVMMEKWSTVSLDIPFYSSYVRLRIKVNAVFLLVVRWWMVMQNRHWICSIYPMVRYLSFLHSIKESSRDSQVRHS